MYEFLCERVIPGCTHRETGETREAVHERAVKHLHEHDGLDYLDDDTKTRLSLAIMPIEAS